MKKPEGNAPAGWYDDPDIEGVERYWEGNCWNRRTRKTFDSSSKTYEKKEMHLGTLLFRSPILNDGVFIAYLIICGLTTIYLLMDFFKFVKDVSSILLLFPATAFTVIWIYILFLLILIPRRIIDKKKGMIKNNLPLKKDLTLDEGEVSRVPKISNKNRFFVLLSSLMALVLILVFISSKSSSKNEGDRYFEVEQRISKVVGEWNVAVTPLSEAIQLISNGAMNSTEARQILGETSSKFAVIHNKLEEECSTIPKYDLNSTGFEFASAKAYDALKVTCDLLPQESVEVLSLVNAQISETSTQADIDYHQNEIAVIIEKRRTAIVESLGAIEPYLNEAQKQTIQRLRDNFLK